MSAIDIPSLLLLCGKSPPPKVPPSWTNWVGSLNDLEAWAITGTLDRHFSGLPSSGVRNGQNELRILLKGLDEELRAWRDRPKEILVYTLASRFAVERGATKNDNWCWRPEHQQVWSAFWPLVRTDLPPRGVRVVRVLGKDLKTVLASHLDQGTCQLLEQLSEPVALVDCINTTEHVAKLFNVQPEQLLPKAALEAYRSLRSRRDQSPPATVSSYTHLTHLSEHLPPALQEKHRTTLKLLLERLKQWAASAPPNKEANEHFSRLLEALPPQVRREFRSGLSALEDDLQLNYPTATSDGFVLDLSWMHGNNEHFLNNWD